MERITLQDLQALWSETSRPCVSIYLPTHAKGPDTQADPIALKNLARTAQQRLAELSLREPEARALLAPLEALVGDRTVWQDSAAGLAVFRSPGLFRTYRLAHPPAERVVVSQRFHTRPLLPGLDDNAPFHVLAVSLNAVRLLRATVHAVQAVPLPAGPQSLRDFTRYDDPQQDPQLRSVGGTTLSFGGTEVNFEDQHRRYLRAIARAVGAALGERSGPLVFAGVAEWFGLFREVADAGQRALLAPRALAGNPDRLSAEALRDRALELLRPPQEAAREAAAADYRRLAGTGRTATGLAQVLLAARDGRVATLLLARDVERWGRFAAGAAGPELHDPPAAGDDELLDLAASLVLQAGGQVLPLPEEMQTAAELLDGAAAILRY